MTEQNAIIIKNIAIELAQRIEHGNKKETILFAACLGPKSIEILQALYVDCLENAENSEIWKILDECEKKEQARENNEEAIKALDFLTDEILEEKKEDYSFCKTLITDPLKTNP